MKCLPIHKGMIPHLQVGTAIVHNGGGNRQGWEGMIVNMRGAHITVYYAALGGVQEYTTKWFQENMYIAVKDIQQLNVFNGTAYILKYAAYQWKSKDLKERNRFNHAEMKAEFAEPEPVKGNWLARSGALILETDTENGLKAAIALAVAEDPSRSFDIYHQTGTATVDPQLVFKEL